MIKELYILVFNSDPTLRALFLKSDFSKTTTFSSLSNAKCRICQNEKICILSEGSNFEPFCSECLYIKAQEDNDSSSINRDCSNQFKHSM